MNTMRMAALALAALLAAVPAPALADPGPGRPGMPGVAAEGVEGWSMMADRHMQRLMETLKLTPEQRGKIETIRARHMEQTKAAREELHRKRRELFELVRSAKATREQAVAKQREVDGLQARLAEARLGAWFEGRAVLTAEQLAQLEKLPMGRGGKRWPKPGKHDGWGGR